MRTKQDIRTANVHIFTRPDNLEQSIEEAFEVLNIYSRINKSDKIYIKPNLTWTVFKEGVTTTPDCVEIVIKLLKQKCENIFLMEGPGGYGQYRSIDAFIGHNYKQFESKYNVGIIETETREVENIDIDGKITVPIPACLLESNVHFITIAVPKVHAMTGISLGIKNQWGCIIDPMRIRYHYMFDTIITKLNQIINPLCSIIDGTYGLTDNGPMEGKPFPFGVYLISDNVFAGDAIMRKIMGWENKKVKHLDLCLRNNLVPENIILNREVIDLVTDKFYLRRTFWNYPALFAFNSRVLTYLFYLSPIEKLLHKTMYLFRKKMNIPTFK
jgi:uncharacterized protein (DUF362 family)